PRDGDLPLEITGRSHTYKASALMSDADCHQLDDAEREHEQSQPDDPQAHIPKAESLAERRQKQDHRHQHGDADVLVADVPRVVPSVKSGCSLSVDRKSTRLNSSHDQISYA